MDTTADCGTGLTAPEDHDLERQVYQPKSFVWTLKNKYPRTVYNVEYRNWSRNPVRDNTNMYSSPLRPFFPPTYDKQFRPLPAEMKEKDALQLRLDLSVPRGIKPPEETLHHGHRRFPLDPRESRFRKRNTPVPHPLDTWYRADFTSPSDTPHLLYKRPEPEERIPSVGIVPALMHYKPPEPKRPKS